MSSELRFVRAASTDDAAWRTAWPLYETAFPFHERRRAEDYAQAFADGRFHADTLWDGDRFVGLCYWWAADDGYAYIEHLAVDPGLRGRNYGARALDALCRRAGRVILEIDPPEDDISRRRRGFYERNGFHYNTYDYVHPSYRRPFRPHRLMVMSWPAPLSPEEMERYRAFMYSAVNACNEK